jgi:O-antigen/teichoic acid export membrane protein
MEQQERKDFVQSSYILMMGYLISSIISSIGTIIVIRLITVEDYSLLSISYIIPAILIVFSELGLNYASTHFIARSIKENNYKEIRDVIRINLIIKSSIGFIFSILVVLYSVYIAVEIYQVNDKTLFLDLC